MASLGGRFLTSLLSLHKLNVEPSIYNGSILQSRNYAVRKGTREKLLKRKLRNIALKRIGEAKAPPKKKKTGVPPDAMRYPETELKVSPDNVWVQKYYSWKIFSFEEAVQAHRDVFHPTMYNIPKAKLKAMFELNMQGASKNKLLSAFNSLVSIPHKFHLDEQRTVLAFAKTPEQQEEARNAGATLVAGPDIVRLIRIGEMTISDFDSIVAHPSMLSELLCVKGIMRSKFPTLKQGTLGIDLKAIIYKHLYGIKYTGTPDLHFPQYGLSEVAFGTIDMSTEQLKENFTAVVESIQSYKPRRPGPFIMRIRIKCPPSKEVLKINLYEFIEEEIVKEEDDDDDDDDEDTVARAEI